MYQYLTVGSDWIKSKEYEFGTSIKYYVIFQMSCPAGFLIMKILLKELCTKDKDAIINDHIRLSS
jgi:hypothetical protein